MKLTLSTCLLIWLTSIAQATDFYVTNTDDSGKGALRTAILDANANLGADKILFAIPGSGWHTIKLLTNLPDIDDEVIIDGYSQAGANYNDGTKRIVISGEFMSIGHQIFVLKSDYNTIQGLVLNRTNVPITIKSYSNNNKIYGNYLGIDSTGTLSLAHKVVGNRTGIFIAGITYGNIIGGKDIGQRNVISGQHDGIIISTNSLIENKIIGNYIGTNATGTSALSNAVGIRTFTNNGPMLIIKGNVISGNTHSGILMGATKNIQIIENTIGLDQSQSFAIPNDAGITALYVESCSITGNFISGNTTGFFGTGINLTFKRNLIGTDGSGLKPVANHIGITLANSLNLPTSAVVGGMIDTDANVISGNTYGIICNMKNTEFYGNIIGLGKNGLVSDPLIGNDHAMSAANVNTLIGGSDITGLGNLVGSNRYSGITVYGNGTEIYGNHIGVDRNGQPAGNGSYGLMINNASKCVIGSDKPGMSNLIANSGANGLIIKNGSNSNRVQSNKIYKNGKNGIIIEDNCEDNTLLSNVIYENDWNGLAIEDYCTDNEIRSNTIYENDLSGVSINESSFNNPMISNSISGSGELGINLIGTPATNPVTTNDYLDVDHGGNDLQNFPKLQSVVPAFGGFLKKIQGTLHSEANSHYYIELFFNPETMTNPSGYGEGFLFMTKEVVHTDQNGDASFSKLIAPSATAGSYSATATKVVLASNGQIATYGSTSEFSKAISEISTRVQARTRKETTSQLSDQHSMEVYPNPASEKLFFNFKTDQPQRLMVFNTQGLMVKAYSLNSNTQSIDVGSLSSGVYYIRSENNSTEAIRFIKE